MRKGLTIHCGSWGLSCCLLSRAGGNRIRVPNFRRSCKSCSERTYIAAPVPPMVFVRCADPSNWQKILGSETARSQNVSTHDKVSKSNMNVILATLTVHVLQTDILASFRWDITHLAKHCTVNAVHCNDSQPISSLTILEADFNGGRCMVPMWAGNTRTACNKHCARLIRGCIRGTPSSFVAS